MGAQLDQPLICYLSLKLPFGEDVKDKLLLGKEKIQDERIEAAVALSSLGYEKITLTSPR